MKSLFIVFVIVLLAAISLSCTKKDDKKTSLKSEEEISDSITKHGQYLWDSILAANNFLTYSFDTTYGKKIKPEKYDLRNVILKGKFNYNKSGGFGHMGVCIAEISDITEIKLLKNTNPDDYLNKDKLMANPDEYNGKIVTVACFFVYQFEAMELMPVEKDEKKFSK